MTVSYIQPKPALQSLLAGSCGNGSGCRVLSFAMHLCTLPDAGASSAGSMFPSYYNRTLFVPEHGSWNRPLEIGYRVVNVKLDANYNAVNHTVFASGWLQNRNTSAQSVWGKTKACCCLLTPALEYVKPDLLRELICT